MQFIYKRKNKKLKVTEVENRENMKVHMAKNED